MSCLLRNLSIPTPLSHPVALLLNNVWQVGGSDAKGRDVESSHQVPTCYPTSRKQAIDSPQKYQFEEALVLVLLQTSTFRVNGSLRRSFSTGSTFSTGWCYLKVLHGLLQKKNISLSTIYNCSIGDMVKQIHARQEVVGLNSSHGSHAPLLRFHIF